MLIVHVPSHTSAPELAPTVVTAKYRGTIHTDRTIYKVAVVITIVYICQEAHKACGGGIAHWVVAFLESTSERRVVQRLVRIAIDGVSALVVGRLLDVPTAIYAHCVLAKELEI